jgi:hypothetical protein
MYFYVNILRMIFDNDSIFEDLTFLTHKLINLANSCGIPTRKFETYESHVKAHPPINGQPGMDLYVGDEKHSLRIDIAYSQDWANLISLALTNIHYLCNVLRHALIIVRNLDSGARSRAYGAKNIKNQQYYNMSSGDIRRYAEANENRRSSFIVLQSLKNELLGKYAPLLEDLSCAEITPTYIVTFEVDKSREHG